MSIVCAVAMIAATVFAGNSVYSYAATPTADTDAVQTVDSYTYTLTVSEDDLNGMYIFVGVSASPNNGYLAYVTFSEPDENGEASVSWYKAEDWAAGTETSWDNQMGRMVGTTAAVTENEDGTYTVVFDGVNYMVDSMQYGSVGSGTEASAVISFTTTSGGTSMASGYFSDEGTVVVNDDGTMTVYFSTKNPDETTYGEGMNYAWPQIVSLQLYESVDSDVYGDALEAVRTEDNGEATYCVTIPYTEETTTVRLRMSIAQMNIIFGSDYYVDCLMNISIDAYLPSADIDAVQSADSYTYTLTVSEEDLSGMCIFVGVSASPNSGYMAYVIFGEPDENGEASVSWYKAEDWAAGTETSWDNQMGRMVGTAASITANEDGTCTVVFAGVNYMVDSMKYGTLVEGETESEDPSDEKSWYYGDVDLNGSVTVDDALAILRHYVRIQPLDETNALIMALADGTKDGSITVDDALYCLQVYVNLISGNVYTAAE